MKNGRYSDAQIMAILKQAEGGVPVSELCREHGMSSEWLGQYIFETIEEAQDQATEWLWTYNNERPNMGIGGMTPAMKLKTAA